MIKDYYIIDNALDNIQEIVSLSKTIKYHSNEDTLIDGIVESKQTKPEGLWRGYRSDLLDEIDLELFKRTIMPVIAKAFRSNKFTYNVPAFIQKAPGSITNKDAWWHTDDSKSLFAGVIYLNENPPPDSGTLVIVNEEILKIENKFNRCVLYNANLCHRPQAFFGNNIDNCRTTLTFFINYLNLEFTGM